MSLFKTPQVFINYRRSDSINEAGRLNNDLENAFGEGFVFQDLEDIDSGTKWMDKLLQAGKNAKVILAVIGPDWLQKMDNQKSRLFDRNDWVRKELELAIQQNKKIIPVLVNGAKIPNRNEIPKSLHALFNYQKLDIRTDKWNHDMVLLKKSVAKLTGVKPLNQNRLKKIIRIAQIFGFLSVLLFAGYFFLPKQVMDNLQMTPPMLDSSIVSKEFCPKFSTAAKVKVLLFPFSNVDGGDHQLEILVKRKITNLCRQHNVVSDVKTPNIPSNEYYDINDAKKECKNCISDILVTGIALKNNVGYGIQADMGFCDSKFSGVVLNENRMQITVANIELASLTSDPDVENSLEYVIEIFLGIWTAQNGELKKSSKILKEAIEKHSDNEMLTKEAYKILWQNQYKLNQKIKCVQTLEKLYNIDKLRIKFLATKSIIEFEQKNYSTAIQDFNKIIDAIPQQGRKEKFLIKRADAYMETQQFRNAKMDYKRVELTPTINAKILKADVKIQQNDQTIKDIKNAGTLNQAQSVALANLQIQNGYKIAATRTLTDVRISNSAQLQQLNLTPEMAEIIEAAQPFFIDLAIFEYSILSAILPTPGQ